jgi:shikimate kinase
MGRRMSTRPLLQKPNPGAELERLLTARRGVYETADVIIDVEDLQAQRVTELVLSRLAEFPP